MKKAKSDYRARDHIVFLLEDYFIENTLVSQRHFAAAAISSGDVGSISLECVLATEINGPRRETVGCLLLLAPVTKTIAPEHFCSGAI